MTASGLPTSRLKSQRLNHIDRRANSTQRSACQHKESGAACEEVSIKEPTNNASAATPSYASPVDASSSQVLLDSDSDNDETPAMTSANELVEESDEEHSDNEDDSQGGTSNDANESASKRPRVSTEAEEKANAFWSNLQLKFAQPADNDKKRKARLLQIPVGKKTSKKKQGSRKADVSQKTLRKRPDQFKGEGYIILDSQLYCEFCKTNIGSSMTQCNQHRNCNEHKVNKVKESDDKAEEREYKRAIMQFQKEVKEDTGREVQGLVQIGNKTQIFRAEALDQFIKAGIPVKKLNKLRRWLERRCGLTLTADNHMQATYLPPLRMKEQSAIRKEFDEQDVGVSYDGTTHNGESFSITARFCDEDAHCSVLCLRVRWYRGSMSNEEISAAVITEPVQYAHIPLVNVLDINNDSCSPNIVAYEETLSKVMPYADHDPCCPHTGCHTGEAMNTPILKEFYNDYNEILVSQTMLECISEKNAGRQHKRRVQASDGGLSKVLWRHPSTRI